MKKLQNEKGVIPVIVIAILSVIIAGVSYGAYRFFNQNSVSLPAKQTELPIVSPKTPEINFTETGELLNWDSRTESYLDEWTLLYAKPGNPAISVRLIFNEESLCDFGEGMKVCDKSKFNNGDRVMVKGSRKNDEITVINLTKL